MSGGALSISWGKSGGFYVLLRPAAWRVCVGRVALTWWRRDLDELLHDAFADHDHRMLKL